jgi:hypothetical protein
MAVGVRVPNRNAEIAILETTNMNEGAILLELEHSAAIKLSYTWHLCSLRCALLHVTVALLIHEEYSKQNDKDTVIACECCTVLPAVLKLKPVYHLPS